MTSSKRKSGIIEALVHLVSVVCLKSMEGFTKDIQTTIRRLEIASDEALNDASTNLNFSLDDLPIVIVDFPINPTENQTRTFYSSK